MADAALCMGARDTKGNGQPDQGGCGASRPHQRAFKMAQDLKAVCMWPLSIVERLIINELEWLIPADMQPDWDSLACAACMQMIGRNIRLNQLAACTEAEGSDIQ